MHRLPWQCRDLMILSMPQIAYSQLYKLPTSSEDSIQRLCTFYGGDKWTNPMHGVGQGNGVGPAIWAVLSTPILNFVQSKGFGCKLISPISQRYTKFVGYAFVNDMDLIQTFFLETIILRPSLNCKALLTPGIPVLNLLVELWYQRKHFVIE